MRPLSFTAHPARIDHNCFPASPSDRVIRRSLGRALGRTLTLAAGLFGLLAVGFLGSGCQEPGGSQASSAQESPSDPSLGADVGPGPDLPGTIPGLDAGGSPLTNSTLDISP
jgi:hypothetical protein